MINIIYYTLIIVILISIYLNFYNQKNKRDRKNVIEKFESNNLNQINANNQVNVNTNNNITVSIFTELIGLDSKYKFDKITVENGKIVKKKNTNWEQDFIKNICNEKCGCDKENGNMCSYKQGSTLFQCPSFCPKCNKCHSIDKNKIQETYESLCDKSKTVNAKEKCKRYEELLKVTKSYCFFRKSVVSNSIKDDSNCEIFNTLQNNNYFYDNDILIRLSFDYNNVKDIDLVKEININEISLGKNIKNFDIFYKTKKELYVYFNPDITDVSDSVELIIKGKIIFNNQQSEQIFEEKAIIRIFERNIEKNDKQYNFSDKKNINLKHIDEEFIPYEDDKYQLNYLKESTFLNCYPVNNHSVYNPIKHLKLTEYKKEKLIDNPSTWVERADIARPWIFTG